MPDSRELYDLLRNAEYDAHPSWRCLTTTHWVMDLEWYKTIRRAFLREDASDEDRDETRWEPQPGDMVLAYPIIVTGDGGAPHLADGRLRRTRELISRYDPEMAGPDA